MVADTIVIWVDISWRTRGNEDCHHLGTSPDS